VKELEQKLELERSSARRHESQITRLRHQLERLQDEKSEDVTHKSNDALNRSHKQIRELRAELQEAERREQEMAKKKRNTVSLSGPWNEKSLHVRRLMSNTQTVSGVAYEPKEEASV
jgi:DNA replication protein DnaC